MPGVVDPTLRHVADMERERTGATTKPRMWTFGIDFPTEVVSTRCKTKTNSFLERTKFGYIRRKVQTNL